MKDEDISILSYLFSKFKMSINDLSIKAEDSSRIVENLLSLEIEYYTMKTMIAVSWLFSS